MPQTVANLVRVHVSQKTLSIETAFSIVATYHLRHSRPPTHIIVHTPPTRVNDDKCMLMEGAHLYAAMYNTMFPEHTPVRVIDAHDSQEQPDDSLLFLQTRIRKTFFTNIKRRRVLTKSLSDTDWSEPPTWDVVLRQLMTARRTHPITARSQIDTSLYSR